MKIAIIGLYYASNLGDAVICDCVESWFRERYPDAQIDVIDINGNTAFEMQQSVSWRILRKRQKNLSRDYWLTRKGIDDKVYFWSNKNLESRIGFYEEVANKGYDIAVFAGGQIFMDWLSLDVCEFLKQFERTKTPVYFNAGGVGISISKKIEEQLKYYLNRDHVKFISSRDDVRKINNKYLPDSKTAIATYDPALWSDEKYHIKKKHSDVIGLGVMYCDQISVRKLVRFWIKVIRELDKRELPWKIFCNGSIHDYNLGCHILDKLKLNKDKYLYSYPKKPEELIEQISSFKGMVSFRLHSHIIAASLDIPAVAIVWDDKLRFFYKHLNHEERCMTVENASAEVVNQLERALKEGYDKELLQKQKEYAKKILFDAVEK